MLLRLLYTSVLLTLINCSFAIAAIPSVKLQTELNINNGLSHNGVSCIYKDSRGYIWIGTYDGLNRYNGQSIVTYKNRVNENLLQSNRIRSIAEDNKNRLWIGTDMGLTIYDYDRETFTPLQIQIGSDNSSLTIVSILHDAQNKQMSCFAVDGTVYNISFDGKLINTCRQLTDISINRTIKIDSEKIFIATNKGLRIYNPKLNSVANIDSQRKIQVNDIAATQNKDEYIIAYGRGMQRVNVSKRDGGYKISELEAPQFVKMQFKRVAVDSNQNIWLGRIQDGVLLIPSGQSPYFGDKVATNMQKKRISDFLFNGDNLYVSTFDGGLFKFSTKQSPFNIIGGNGEYKQAQITPFPDNNILVRTGTNLTLVTPDNNNIIETPFKLNKNIQSATKVPLIDKDGLTWIVYKHNDGSTRIVKTDQRQRVIPIDDSILQISTLGAGFNIFPVEAIFDRWGNIWIGYQNNLYRIVLNEKQNKVLNVEWINQNPYFEDRVSISKVRVLYSDPKDGSIWLGTTLDGLYRISLNSETTLANAIIDNYTYESGTEGGLSSKFISSIMRSSKGVLYIGTEQGGVCIADESSENIRFDVLSEREGLSNNVVKSLTEDVDGNIWIGTNIGLNMLLGGSEKGIRVFKLNNGLPSEDFWYYSFRRKDGCLVMSNVDGLTVFNPKEVSTQTEKPQLYFDRLNINNENVQSGVEFEGRVVMNNRLKNNDSIKLKYNENLISIKVDAICDFDSSNNTILYKLSPGNSEWITSKDGQITLANMQSGRYKLMVTTPDLSDSANDILSLNILISPPFWRSGLAYFIYILIIASCFITVLFIMMKFQSLNHRLEIRGIEKSNSENKLRYLSNVSHELKTPLSLILAPLAVLQEKFIHDTEVKAKLETIKRQSKKMLEIIDLTHGVEVNDLKMMRLSPSRVSFSGVVNYLSPDFEFMADYDNKIFEIESKNDTLIDVIADLGMLEKIITNLLSNAFKHTLAGDKIKLQYWIENENLIFQVEDTGCGIDEEDLPKIFERFFQAKRSSGANFGGTGIGLTLTKRLVELHEGKICVESKIDIGTTFTVTLPNATIGIVESEANCQERGLNELVEEMDFTEIVIQSEYASSSIFLVEDNAELRIFLEEIIGRYFKVRSFAEPLLMLEALETEWPDLIVSDVMMPNMDGYELCHRVKNNIQTSHIPVILLTACNTVEQKIKGLNSGADAYIPKPFYPKHVITRIETLLNNRQILRERFQIGIPLVMGRKGDTSAKDNEFMARLYDYFNVHLDNEEINIDETAKEMGQNRTMFFKKIKSITNRSPYELLKEYRLKRAAELLQSAEYNVNEVCAMVGFKDRSHFSRLFKEKYGSSPSKYAKS